MDTYHTYTVCKNQEARSVGAIKEAHAEKAKERQFVGPRRTGFLS